MTREWACAIAIAVVLWALGYTYDKIAGAVSQDSYGEKKRPPSNQMYVEQADVIEYLGKKEGV